MEAQETRDRVRESIESYLSGRGIQTNKPFRCLNPAHEDRHPSMKLDKQNHRVHCFACNATYDIFDLIGMEYGLTEFKQQLEKAAALTNIPLPRKKSSHKPAPAANPPGPTPEEIAAYIKAAQSRLPQTDYHTRRGISHETAQSAGLGYDPAFTQSTGGRTWRALIIPTGPASYTARNTDPAAEKQHRVRKVGGAPLYTVESAPETAPLFIVEGELDALSLREIGARALALGGVAGVRRFLDAAREAPPPGGVILCLDADDSGEKASASLRQGLEEAAIPCTRATLPTGCKDPNDALIADRDAFLQWAGDALAEHAQLAIAQQQAALDAYRATSVRSALQSFLNGISEGANTPCISTGYPMLDTALDGGLYEGLYILGAITSLGKTTFALQMADQIAQSGQDVLIFSLEMARNELMAKSISRQTLARCLRDGTPVQHAKTARGITDGRRYSSYGPMDMDVIRTATRAYHDIAGHLYIHEGIGDIGADAVRACVRRHVEVSGQRPVVLVDYLQIMAPADVRASDKQNTDKTVLELKRISRDFKIPVIGISSFNRENYKNPVSMVAFKESGAIEYSSDVLIGMQLRGAGEASFDAEAAKQRDPRDILLKVLKNRNGRVGAAIGYLYYPMFNLFTEEGAKEAIKKNDGF